MAATTYARLLTVIGTARTTATRSMVSVLCVMRSRRVTVRAAFCHSRARRGNPCHYRTPSPSGAGAAATATFSGDTDGSDNWQALCDAVSDEGTSGNYPAWEWVNSYATENSLTGTTYANGWYIPTVAELCVLYRAVKAESSLINSALEALDGSRFNHATYLSSSQGSSETYWRVQFGGYLDTLFREADATVCAVRAF